MGGSLQARLYPRSEDERRKAIEAGYDLDALLFQDDLCKGEQVRGSPAWALTHLFRTSLAWADLPNQDLCTPAHLCSLLHPFLMVISAYAAR